VQNLTLKSQKLACVRFPAHGTLVEYSSLVNNGIQQQVIINLLHQHHYVNTDGILIIVKDKTE